ncbi:MAG: thioredoxin domain-containing protein [Croceibacterium sp.]
MTAIRRTTLALLIAAPLALGLAACNKSDGSTGAASTAAAIAPVAAPAGKAWTDVVAPTKDGGMLMGNPNAPLKLVEYGSLSCPHCAKLANEGMEPLKTKYVTSGRVSYEFRSLMIHGIIDMPLTMMLQCASPDAYFGLVEQLYTNQDAVLNRAQQANAQAEAATKLPPAQRYAGLADAFGLTDWFAERGVSVDQSRACLSNTQTAEQIAKVTETASAAGVDSTPTLFLNGAKLTDVTSWAQLEPALQNAGAR